MDPLSSFREIWAADFEYRAPPGERPDPVCLVARELRTGREVRLFREELRCCPLPPYPTHAGSLFVAYNAPAELSCHLVLDWPTPRRILDLYAEFRWLNSGRRATWPGGFGLVGALTFFGLDPLDGAEKNAMRELAMSDGSFSPQEAHALLQYCAGDVAATAELFERAVPFFDLQRALLRGRYMDAVARMVHRGIPLDTPLYESLREHWSSIKRRLIDEVDNRYGVYDGITFKQSRFVAFVEGLGVPWPMTSCGRPCLDRKTFEQQAKRFPVLEDLRYLRELLNELKNFELEVGSDSRNRTSLFPFGTATGRNAPSTTGFIFGLPAFLRSLIRPPAGYSLAYVDWSAQEIAIAAALSGDDAMIDAYRSGDPHLGFAVQAGLAPKDATKETHTHEREIAKGCGFGVMYGMGGRALAARLGCSLAEAEELLALHRRTYPRFWRWVEGAVEHGFLYGKLHTVHGWQRNVTPETRNNQLQNFCIQGAGADMLRLACCFAIDVGVEIVAPVHDAILVQAPTREIETAVLKTRETMERASRHVLSELTVRTDSKVVSYPDRGASRSSRRPSRASANSWNVPPRPGAYSDGCGSLTEVSGPTRIAVRLPIFQGRGENSHRPGQAAGIQDRKPTG